MIVFHRFFSVICAASLCACSSGGAPDYESWKTATPYTNARGVANTGGGARPVPAQTLPVSAQVSAVSSTTEILPVASVPTAPTPATQPAPTAQPPAPIATAAVNTGPDKLTVDFGFFPKGTTCEIFGTRGDVRVKVGKEIEYTISGDTGNVSFTCRQPDGMMFSVNTAPLIPAGNLRRVALQINQDNNAYALWDQGGLRQRAYPGILKWQ